MKFALLSKTFRHPYLHEEDATLLCRLYQLSGLPHVHTQRLLTQHGLPSLHHLSGHWQVIGLDGADVHHVCTR